MKDGKRLHMPGFKPACFYPFLNPNVCVLGTIFETMETEFFDWNTDPHEVKSKIFAL